MPLPIVGHGLGSLGRSRVLLVERPFRALTITCNLLSGTLSFDTARYGGLRGGWQRASHGL